MENRITAISLGVTDIAAARRFYIDGMGLTPVQEVGDEVSFFNLAPGLVLALFNGLAEDARIEQRGPGLFSIAHNVREKDQVDQILARAKAAGATITKPGTDTDWGGRSGYFADPEGHLWEIAWNPDWPIAEDGSVRIVPPKT